MLKILKIKLNKKKTNNNKCMSCRLEGPWDWMSNDNETRNFYL